MEIYQDLSNFPADFGPSVVTIGNFDGVHAGHAAVLGKVVELAEEHQLVATAVSFDPHPSQVHQPQSPVEQIMGQADRKRFLAEAGIDAYVLIHYTLAFAQQTPAEFVRSTFVEKLHAKFVVIGDDVRFGRNNEGDLATMHQLGAEHGFEVVTVADLMADASRRCSSTRIRQLLARGEVAEAARLLGRPHLMSGEIVHGAARGRQLGFPTANLSFDAEGFIPADGVYAGWLTDASGRRHPVATSIGKNPTFDGIERTQVEAHVIDRPESESIEDFNLYGQHVVLEFVAQLRDIVAYTGPEALIEQMQKDVAEAKKVLGV